jgi:hypothetical protein
LPVYAAVWPPVERRNGSNDQGKINRWPASDPSSFFEGPGQCKRPRTFLRTIAKIAMAVGTLLFNIALFPKIISSPFKLFQVPRINRPRRNQYDFCPREVMSLIDQTTPHQPRSVKDALCDWIPRKC